MIDGPMDDGTRQLLAEFVQAAKDLKSTPPRPMGGGTLDRRQIALLLIGWAGMAAVSMLGNPWGAGGLSGQLEKLGVQIHAITDQVQTVGASASQNAGEIRRVDADSRERDKGLHDYIDDKISSHEHWAHKNRGASLFSWPPGLPILSAAQAGGR